MHPDHATLLAELRAAAPATPRGGLNNDSYGGSGRPFFGITAPVRRAIARRWASARRDAATAEILAVVESLSEGDTHEERTEGAFLLAALPAARRAAGPEDVERWLGRLNGWAEIDCLCQNLFTWADMAGDWPAWTAMVERLRGSDNINKRRAALVLLNGPVGASDDPRPAALAFEVLDALEGERHILITKAVSWLLRSLTKRHREAVKDYLDRNQASLPAIAVRETRAKLATGTKSGRRAVPCLRAAAPHTPRKTADKGETS
jgi:3-methyladenine DNA glycosylase AlkD